MDFPKLEYKQLNNDKIIVVSEKHIKKLKELGFISDTDFCMGSVKVYSTNAI